MTLEQALRISLEGAVLAALVGAICGVVPRLRAGHRAILWWLVGAKLLVGFVPLPAVRVAALPAATEVAAAAAAPTAVEVAASPSPATARGSGLSPARAASWAWLLGGSLLCLGAIPDWLRVHRWLRTGRALDDEGWRTIIARARGAVGLRRTPSVLAVPGLGTPLVTGLLRPVVLLPAEDLERFESGELEMVLAHEMAHVRRGDLWLGLVPALARRLFFFHPAAWIAEREYAIAREAACDEAVLGRQGAEPFAYARLLLRLSTGRSLRTAIPMSPLSMLRRRLEMIDAMARRVPIGRAAWILVAVAALAMVPVRIVAKESPESRCLDIGSGTNNAYIITDGKTHSMCGDIGDVRRAEEHRHNGEDVIWFRVDDQDWVVRDPALVAEARRLFAGVSKLGERQSAIGAQQSRLGAEQSRIGREQGAIGIQQAIEAQVEAERALQLANETLRQAGRDVDDAKLDEADAATRSKEAAVEERKRAEQGVEEVSARMRELGERMTVLGRQQAELGDRQRVLGEKMTREVAEAQRALSRLLERAMRDGTALRAA